MLDEEIFSNFLLQEKQDLLNKYYDIQFYIRWINVDNW